MASVEQKKRIAANDAAMKALRAARVTGAPFTEPGDPHHEALVRLERAGVVRGRKVGKVRVYWSEVD